MDATMWGMRTIVLSDLHLGSGGDLDVLRRPEIRRALWAELEGADQVVLLGDAVELRDRPLAEALELARPFFDELDAVIGAGRVVVVPGNHDHHLLAGWLERRRLEGAGALGLEQRVEDRSGALATLLAGMRRASIELSYPGLWLRPGVYATHGHYLDRHLTVPTFERLAVAAVERILGGTPEVSEEPGSARDFGSASVEDYERIQAPVYAFLFALAQAGGAGGRLAGASPSARVWQALGGGYGRAAKVRGWLLGTVALPGAVGVANRLGLGPVKPDLSPGAITRGGLSAIGEVVRRLGIDADHLVFGHTHRRGPMKGETGWRLPEGTRLWNTGSWVYAPGIVGASSADSPYWPGTIAVVEDDGSPELRHVLDAHSREELRG
jgi:predicted phosphodiesterase